MPIIFSQYNSDHPKVLESAHILIQALSQICEFYEQYARITYECLTRPIDKDDEQVRANKGGKS